MYSMYSMYNLHHYVLIPVGGLERRKDGKTLIDRMSQNGYVKVGCTELYNKQGA